MSDNTYNNPGRPGEPGDQNVERLLQSAYDPPVPSDDFVGRTKAAMLAAARRRAKDAQPQPAGGQRRSIMLRFARPLAACAAAAAIIVAAYALYMQPPQADTTARLAGSAAPSPAPAFVAHNSPADDIEMLPAEANADSQHLSPRPAVSAPPAPRIAVGDTIRTGPFDRSSVTLPDGSILYVNAGTHLVLEADRRVNLQAGEVYVEVQPHEQGAGADANAGTFVVRTPTREVTAMGTQFSVKADTAGTSVLVTQGKVRVDGLADLLYAGRQLLADNTTAACPRPSTALDWMGDLMAMAQSPLVPRSDHAGGSLIASNAEGEAVALSLRKYHVDVHIEDGFARTTIDQTYFNADTRRLEGTFYFPLPADASLSRLAMYVDGRLMEGGMAERDHARNVFELIVRRMKDPALLEWVDGTTFKMRVFPLEGRQEKRIVLSYSQRLANEYGRSIYRFPSGHNLQKVREWSFHARLKNAASPATPLRWSCESHTLQSRAEGGDLLLDASARDAKLDGDVVLHLTDGAASRSQPAARFSGARHDGAEYLMLRYRPALDSQPVRQRRDWVVLFESSADRDPLLARAQIEVIRSLLGIVEHDDRFAVLTVGTHVYTMTDGLVPATQANVRRAIEKLQSSHLVGALDLESGLVAARDLLRDSPQAHLVHVGNGTPVLGERRVEALAGLLTKGTRYVGIGVGKNWNRSFMKTAAAASDGLFTQINPDENIAWRTFELLGTLNTPRLMDLRVVDDAEGVAFLCDTDAVMHGQEICAIARVAAGARRPAAVKVTGTVSGQPWSQTIAVRDVAAGADYLPRSWAKLEIDRLVAAGAETHKNRIVELSKSMYVMSPFTSLLVLENEAMYSQYGVDRGRKDHWALYPCPPSIPVVTEPIGTGAAVTPPTPTVTRSPAPRAAAAPARKASAADVLETILFRLPQVLSPQGMRTQAAASALQLYRGAYAVPIWTRAAGEPGPVVSRQSVTLHREARPRVWANDYGQVPAGLLCSWLRDYTDEGFARGGWLFHLVGPTFVRCGEARAVVPILPDIGADRPDLLDLSQRGPWSHRDGFTAAHDDFADVLVSGHTGLDSTWTPPASPSADEDVVFTEDNTGWYDWFVTYPALRVTGARFQPYLGKLDTLDDITGLVPLNGAKLSIRPRTRSLIVPGSYRWLLESTGSYDSQSTPVYSAALTFTALRSNASFAGSITGGWATQGASGSFSGGSYINGRSVNGLLINDSRLDEVVALAFDSGNSYTGTTTVSGGTLQLGAAVPQLLGKAGPGSATNTYTGTTVVNGGVLNSIVLNGGPLRLNDAATVTSYGGSIALTKSGAGTIDASQMNTYTGTGSTSLTISSSGILDLNGFNDGGLAAPAKDIGTKSITLRGDAILAGVNSFHVNNASTRTGTLNLSGGFAAETLGNVVLKDGGLITGSLTLNSGVGIQKSLTLTGAITGSGYVASGNISMTANALPGSSGSNTMAINNSTPLSPQTGVGHATTTIDGIGWDTGFAVGSTFINAEIHGIQANHQRQTAAPPTVLPWALGDTSATAEGIGFVTYDASQPLRLLTASEYFGNSLTPNAKTLGTLPLSPRPEASNGSVSAIEPMSSAPSGYFFYQPQHMGEQGTPARPAAESPDKAAATRTLLRKILAQPSTMSLREATLNDIQTPAMNAEIVERLAGVQLAAAAGQIEWPTRAHAVRDPQAARAGDLLHRPARYVNDLRKFGDLLLYAPGLNTSLDDVQAVLEAEGPLDEQLPPGTIDVRAAKLIDRCRQAPWQTITLPGGDILTFDGAGRYVQQGRTAEGLAEKIVCDGKTIVHMYGDLGLASRRPDSRFHRRTFIDRVPWLVPAAADLARGANVSLIGDNTVAVTPTRGTSAEHLVFGEGGRLVERQLLRDGSVAQRQTYDASGKITTYDASGAVAVARTLPPSVAIEPSLTPDLHELVVLAMPLRSVSHLCSMENHFGHTDMSELSDEQVLAGICSRLGDGRGDVAQAIGQRWLTRGDRRLGLWVLLAANGGTWDSDGVLRVADHALPLEPARDHPDSAVAKYVQTSMRGGGAKWLDANTFESLPLLHDLALLQSLQSNAQGDGEAVLRRLGQFKTPAVAWTAAALACEAAASKDFYRRLGAAAATLPEAPAVSASVRFSIASKLSAAGDAGGAAAMFETLFRKQVAAGQPPLVNAAMVETLRQARGGDAFASLAREASAQWAARGQAAPAIVLAAQCEQLAMDSLAQEIRQSLGKDNNLSQPLAAAALRAQLAAGEWDKAAASLKIATQNPQLAQNAWLWWGGYVVHEMKSNLGAATACLDRALDLECQHLGDTVEVAKIHADYSLLMSHYEQLVRQTRMDGAVVPGEQMARIVRAADRWRALTGEEAPACRAAARVFMAAGAYELSWEYATTPLASRPGEPGPMAQLGDDLRTSAMYPLAMRAFAAAFLADPTDPRHLLEQARTLELAGERERAMEFYRQIVDGQWRAEFDSLRRAAMSRLANR